MILMIIVLATATAVDCESLNDPGPANACRESEQKLWSVVEASREANRLLARPEVKAELTAQRGWKSALTRTALQQRRAQRRSAEPEIRGHADLLLEQLLIRQPGLLAPRAMRYHRCGQALPLEPAYAEQAVCREEQAMSLSEHHPDNAFGHVLLAEGAWAAGDLAAAADHMERAGTAVVLNVGLRPAVQAMFAVLDPLLSSRWDDAIPHRQLGLYSAIFDLLGVQFPDVVKSIGHRCQTTAQDAMLSPCLALARALRLPGASVSSVKLSLAVEGAVYQRRGDEERARQAGRLRVAAQQAFTIDSADMLQLDQPYALSAVEAVLKYGEAYARVGEEPALIDLIKSVSQDEDIESLAPCDPHTAGPSTAGGCLKSSTYWSELMVLADFLGQQAQSPEMLARWARHPDPDLRVLHAHHLQIQEGRLRPDHPESLALLEQVVEAHPDAWFPRRVLMDRCISAERWDCVEKATLAEASADPANGFAALQLAGLAVEQGNRDRAREWIRLAGQATRYDRGFGGLASGFYESYQKALAGPAVDPLNLRNAAILSMSLGIAAAVSSVDAKINMACREAQKLSHEDCLEAARIMQLPGGDFLAVMMGLALEERVYKDLGDETSLADTLEKQAKLRQLMTALDLDYVLQTQNTADYVKALREHGEIGAYRRFQTRSPEGSARASRAGR